MAEFRLNIHFDPWGLPLGRTFKNRCSEILALLKFLATGNWKLFRNANTQIFSPVSTAVDPVENLDSLDDDCFAVVNGNPWCTLIECVTHVTIFI